MAETAAWCLRGTLLNDVPESEEIQRRRALGKQAFKLSHESYLNDGPEFWKSGRYAQVKRMFAEARLEEIAPLEHQLRFPTLKPTQPTSQLNMAQWLSVVDQLAEKRAYELRIAGRYPKDICDQGNGRLMVYFPEENLLDGAAKYPSKGFFDVENLPPWDTWVCFFDKRLIAWVPNQLVDLANEGIYVNPEQCIQWADQLQFYPR